MTCDELVSGFGNRCESRNVIVAPRQPFSRRSISQRAVDGFRSQKSFAVRLNESHRAPELIARDFGESVGDFLISGVIDFTGGDLSPALDPQLAKMTFSVPDQERLGWWIGNPLTALVSHKRRTSNVQRSTSNSESEFSVLCSMLGVRRYLNPQIPPTPAHLEHRPPRSVCTAGLKPAEEPAERISRCAHR